MTVGEIAHPQRLQDDWTVPELEQWLEFTGAWLNKEVSRHASTANTPRRAKHTITAGRLLWNDIRNAIKERQFRGQDIQYHEGSGWLERPFMIEGEASAVLALLEDFHRWWSEND